MKKLNMNEFVNNWLEAYHNTSLDNVAKENNWDKEEDHSRKFYLNFTHQSKQIN